MALTHLKGPRASAAGGAVVEALRDPQLGLATPALEEFLRSCEFEPGKPRRTGTILLFTEGGQWKACLSDRHSGLVTFVTGSDYGALLESAEGVLRGEGGDWRPTRASQRK